MVETLEEISSRQKDSREYRALKKEYRKIENQYRMSIFGIEIRKKEYEVLKPSDVDALHKITAELYVISSHCVRNEDIHLNSRAVSLNIAIHKFIKDYARKQN